MTPFDQSQYLTPIPATIFEKLPIVALANHSGTAFDVRLNAFPGDDGEQLFAVDVFTDAERVVPTDRRQSTYTQARQTTYFFDAEGTCTEPPLVRMTRYRG